MARIIGKGITTKNYGVFDDSGYWEVTTTITETQEYDDGTFLQETIEAKCMDLRYDMALQTALASALISYREETLDRNEGNLVDARKKYGKSNASNSNPNTQA